MKTKKAIKKILKQEHMTQKVLSEKMGYARPSSLNTVLRANNPKIETLVNIIDALGYEVVLRPKNGSDKVSRSVILNNEEE